MVSIPSYRGSTQRNTEDNTFLVFYPKVIIKYLKLLTVQYDFPQEREANEWIDEIRREGWIGTLGEMEYKEVWGVNKLARQLLWSQELICCGRKVHISIMLAKMTKC
jgi:hypothetical protein